MGPAEVREHCPLDDAGRSLPLASRSARLRAAMTQLAVSVRAFHRTRSVKLARTIAKLGGREVGERIPEGKCPDGTPKQGRVGRRERPRRFCTPRALGWHGDSLPSRLCLPGAQSSQRLSDRAETASELPLDR